jgi:ketosteroid isomerase-like protein
MEGNRQEANVDLVRRGVDAYNRGDIEIVLALLADDVEVYTPTELGNPGIYHGHQGYLEWSKEWEEAWEEFRIEPQEIEPVGDDHVVVTVKQFARGVGSGVEVEMELCQLYEVGEDGKAKRFHLYADREAAHAAVERFRRDPDASP